MAEVSLFYSPKARLALAEEGLNCPVVCDADSGKVHLFTERRPFGAKPCFGDADLLDVITDKAMLIDFVTVDGKKKREEIEA